MPSSACSSAYLPDALNAAMKWPSPLKNSLIAANMVENIENIVIALVMSEYTHYASVSWVVVGRWSPWYR